MKDRDKAQDQLIKELAQLRQRIAELEKSEVEREQVEEALGQSYQRYRVLAEATFEGIFLSEEGRFLEMNDQYARMLGYEKQELIGKDVSSVIFPEDRPRVLKNIREGLESIIENRAVMKDGTVIMVKAHGKPFLYHGRPVRLSAVRDITEQKQADEKLREGENRFRAIADYTYDWENWFDMNGKLVWVNPGVFRLTGYTVDECLAMTDFPLPLIDREDRDRLASHLAQVIQGSSGNDVEFRIRCKDGSLKWTAVSWQPIYNADGFCLGRRSSVRDITDRKRAEKRTQDTLHFLQTLIDTIPSPIFYKDTDGIYQGCNKAYEKCIGLKKGELTGKSVYDVFPGGFADKYHEMDSLLFRQKENLTEEHQTIYPDGSVHDVIIEKAIYLNADGATAGLVGVMADITERKRYEQKIQELNKELEQRIVELKSINQELRTLNYSVSHDLRTPLVAIQGFSRRLSEKYAGHLDEKGRKYLRNIHASSVQMAELLDDLLTFFSFGPKKVGFSQVKMDEIVREVFDELREVHSEQVIKWDIKFLPNAKGDKRMLRQVFANLLNNAVKYSKPRETAVIEVGGWTEKDKNVYYVKDNGIGIPMEHADRIFQVFERLHTSEKLEGTGVGLAIVKRVIDRHGGKVWVDSKVDGGTTFYFSIPQ